MSLFIPDDFRDTYPTMPTGVDRQGRYRTRQPGDVARRITDDNYAATYHGDGIARYRNGQPMAGEDCADTGSAPRWSSDGIRTVLLWVASTVFVGAFGWHLIAAVWPIIAGWLA